MKIPRAKVDIVLWVLFWMFIASWVGIVFLKMVQMTEPDNSTPYDIHLDAR
jgi:hypothetical protein